MREIQIFYYRWIGLSTAKFRKLLILVPKRLRIHPGKA